MDGPSNLVGVAGLLLAAFDIYLPRRAEAVERWLDALPGRLAAAFERLNLFALVASARAMERATRWPDAAGPGLAGLERRLAARPARTFVLLLAHFALSVMLLALLLASWEAGMLPLAVLLAGAAAALCAVLFGATTALLAVALLVRAALSLLNGTGRGNALAGVGLLLAMADLLL